MSRTSAARGSVETRSDRGTRAYEQLRELIVHGRLAPGAWVIETDIAQRLGISRTPVRAALQRLNQEGYIQVVPRGHQYRATVAPLTKDDSRELFAIVGQVEALAARWAAELEAGPRGALSAKLREINGELLTEAERERPDAGRLFDLDQGFHRTYVERAAGPRLLGLHDAVKPQSERYIRLYVSALTREIVTSVAEHTAILEAIARGDVVAAQATVETNWKNAAERFGGVIEHMGELGSW